MSAPIGPGDWVECINPQATSIRYGGVYCVAGVFDSNRGCEVCGTRRGIDLEGVFDPLNGWCAGCEVRPIYRPKAEMIESLKAPPRRVKEPA